MRYISENKRTNSDFDKDMVIFRAPTKKELIAAAEYADVNLSSDFQMQQIRVLSKVLFDFGLLDKIYKAKKDDWNYGKTNAAETDKMLKNIGRIFSATKYSPDSSTEILAEDLQNSTTCLEKEFGVRIPEIIGAFDKWVDIMKFDPKTVSKEFPEGFNPNLMANVEAVSGTNYKETYKKVNEHLIDVMLSNKYNTPKDYAKYVSKNETTRAILDEPIVKKLVNNAFSSNDIKDIEEFVLFLKTNLIKNRIARKDGNTMTIIHHKALERIRYFDLIMKRKGYKDGIYNFCDMIDFLKETDSNTLEYICNTYNITVEELKEIGSYENFFNWLFGNPERLYAIIESIGTNVRSRAKGDIRKGANLAVLYQDLLEKESKLRDDLDNNLAETSKKRGPRAKSRKELEKELINLQKAYEELTDDLKLLKSEAGSEHYEKVKALRFKTGKKVSAIKFTISKRPADEKPSTSIEDDIEKYRLEREALLNREEERLSGDELAAFKDKYDIEKTRRKMGDYDIGSGYLTMAFSLKVNPTDEEAISFIENRLKKFVSKYEEKNGKRSRANVSSTISTYKKRNLHTDEMESRECTRFLIDYPKNSAIYNTIKNKNDKERLEFVAMVIGFVGKGMIKQFGSMPPVIQDSRNNKVEYMNDELSFSFN